MAWTNLIDGPSAAIVFGGTFVATALRAGWGELIATGRALASLPRRGFAAEEARAKLAAQVIEIRQDGILRTQPRHSGDAEFDEATDAMIARRSISALLERHEAHKARRIAGADIAVRTLAQAAELAPAFGLVGTLVSLSQLPADGLAQGRFMGAISMAVLTTLYGLLAANLLCAPLSRAVERAAEREERERQQVIDWLMKQVAPAIPLAERPRPQRPHRDEAPALPSGSRRGVREAA